MASCKELKEQLKFWKKEAKFWKNTPNGKFSRKTIKYIEKELKNKCSRK